MPQRFSRQLITVVGWLSSRTAPGEDLVTASNANPLRIPLMTVVLGEPCARWAQRPVRLLLAVVARGGA